MLKMLLLPIIATIGAGAIPASLQPIIKPAPPPGGTIIVTVLPDGNYVIDGENANKELVKTLEHKTEPKQTADSRLDAMKKQLDKRFNKMFSLKQQLEDAQNEMGKKWNEYYAMNEAYNKELKRIIADWVTDNMYEAK